MRRSFSIHVQLALGLVVLLATGLSSLAGKQEDEAPGCWPSAPGTDPRLCPPNDPDYPGSWEFRSDIPEELDRSKMHPSELAQGAIGFSLDRAWQHTIGRPEVLIAVLDSGIRWEDRELVRKLYLNRGELPLPAGAEAHDSNADGRFNIDDYDGDPRVRDTNGNGFLDAQDLIAAFSDCVDNDGNGYPDDISGYDFFSGEHCGRAGGDNDPHDETDFGHGSGIASSAAAEANNGKYGIGVCPNCSILPVRVGDSFVVDINQFARGLIFATRSGADVVASALGSYNNTPAGRFAVDYAWNNGVTIVASAADEFSYHHNYPSVYNHTVYVNAIRFNHHRDWEEGSTFWGLNPCTNFGARVSLSVPAESCSSGATSRLAGAVGLLYSAALESGVAPLHAEEALQLLRTTTDDLDNSSPDWGKLRYAARTGFDQLTGYGRLNAHAAVTATKEGRIPPIVDLDGPRWFAMISPKLEPQLSVSGSIRLPRAVHAIYRLEYALGVEPAEQDYVTIASGMIDEDREGPLGVLDFTKLPLPRGPAPRNRSDRDRYSATLRLSVTDDRGLRAETRRSFFVHDDPSAKRNFPHDIGASGEAPPLLVDLDGDGADEIILPTASGELLFIDWEPTGLRITRALLDNGPPLLPIGTIEGAVVPREGSLRGAVVGDIHGNGFDSVVVASREGKVYAFSPHGERIAGFPVSISPELSVRATELRRTERGLLSQPTLADLDGRPGKEIVVTSLDGHVYVWSGDGRPFDGFPVAIFNPELPEGTLDKIVSSAAVGDLDGDGVPEIVLGSNGLLGSMAGVYALRANGNLHPGGPFLPGWQPFGVAGVRADLLPTLASGVAMTPLLHDLDSDGDDEVMFFAVTGDAIQIVDQPAFGPPRLLFRGSMAPGVDSGFRGVSFLAGTGAGHIVDTDGDGRVELYAPLLPLRMVTMRSKPGVPIDIPVALGGWEIPSGADEDGLVEMMDGYPRRMEDMMICAQPDSADVDRDGIEDVLMGSGGYLLHAFRREGGEVEGFPKFTGGWIFSNPAVGDIDGDGRSEIVTVTREGYLFAWELEPQRPAPALVRLPVDPGR